MSSLSWPVALQPNQFSLKLFSAAVRGKSIFAQTSQTVNLLNDRWTAELSIDRRSDGSELETFCNSLRNGSAVVEFGHFFRPNPLGTLQVDTVASEVALSGSKFLKLAATDGLTLLAGDYLGVNGLLVQVAVDCAAAGGVLDVPLSFRLRKPVEVGATVTVSNPTCRFRLLPGTSPNAAYEAFSVQVGVTLSFLEVVS